ncbi:MAG: hypothetical protein NZ874_00060 [Fimbriimonadales bacterium]|nr:hypothetical protein [Fimbriimonadales bacterium]
MHRTRLLQRLILPDGKVATTPTRYDGVPAIGLRRRDAVVPSGRRRADTPAWHRLPARASVARTVMSVLMPGQDCPSHARRGGKRDD